MGSIIKLVKNLGFLTLLILYGQNASAQSTASIAKEFDALTPEQKILFEEISNDLRCPTCTGLSILQSDAPFSLQIRQAVLDQVKTGNKKAEIIDFFTERYGLWILREPPKKGFHFLAWLIPSLFLILGPLLIWFFVWRKRQQVSTFGIRPTKEIIKEFEDKLKAQRNNAAG